MAAWGAMTMFLSRMSTFGTIREEASSNSMDHAGDAAAEAATREIHVSRRVCTSDEAPVAPAPAPNPRAAHRQEDHQGTTKARQTLPLINEPSTCGALLLQMMPTAPAARFSNQPNSTHPVGNLVDDGDSDEPPWSLYRRQLPQPLHYHARALLARDGRQSQATQATHSSQ